VEPEEVGVEEVDEYSRAVVSFVPWAWVELQRSSRVVHMQTYAPIVGIAWAHFSSKALSIGTEGLTQTL